MGSRIRAVFIELFTFIAAGLAHPPMPHLERRGAVTQLILDGKPWLALGGELLNNAASTGGSARPVRPALARMHLNTVLVGVGWGWTEPEPRKYDFSTLDAALREARSSGLRLVLLWFGSWKNGTSSYPPAWVKRNWQKYQIARDGQVKGREILSALAEVNRDADVGIRSVNASPAGSGFRDPDSQNCPGGERGRRARGFERPLEGSERGIRGAGAEAIDGLPSAAQERAVAGNQKAVGRRRQQDFRKLGAGFWEGHRRGLGFHGLALCPVH